MGGNYKFIEKYKRPQFYSSIWFGLNNKRVIQTNYMVNLRFRAEWFPSISSPTQWINPCLIGISGSTLPHAWFINAIESQWITTVGFLYKAPRLLYLQKPRKYRVRQLRRYWNELFGFSLSQFFYQRCTQSKGELRLKPFLRLGHCCQSLCWAERHSLLCASKNRTLEPPWNGRMCRDQLASLSVLKKR